MVLARYETRNPWSQFHQELNRMLGEGSSVATSDWVPVVDIREDKDQFVLHADLPGVKREDIDITMEEGVLSIRGERRLEEVKEEGEYKRIERAHGTFYRRFSLPDTADPDKISARCNEGVLEVVIPKRETVKPRRIEIGK
ncbi:MAG: Hsp20/alpha crystallin family protein [Halofilum sp. (in: g-proteobacteria)]|nr:Hsp20/alpha crystallin family protein [Halofilum sp. (in: g-proteobacteria)]